MTRHELIRLRADLGLTQAQLAELLACTQAYVHCLERGKKPIPDGLRLMILAALEAALRADLGAARRAVAPGAPVPVRLARVFRLAHP